MENKIKTNEKVCYDEIEKKGKSRDKEQPHNRPNMLELLWFNVMQHHTVFWSGAFQTNRVESSRVLSSCRIILQRIYDWFVAVYFSVHFSLSFLYLLMFVREQILCHRVKQNYRKRLRESQFHTDTCSNICQMHQYSIYKWIYLYVYREVMCI